MSDILYSVNYELVVKEENETVTYSLIPVIEESYSKRYSYLL